MDFDFAKAGQNEKSVKGAIRRKIQVLPDMMTLMKSDVQVEEGFRKNRVVFAGNSGWKLHIRFFRIKESTSEVLDKRK